MPLISRIGRKHPRTRLLIAGIYLLLAAGAVTMVYPFLLMLAGSTKTAVDSTEQTVVPRFLRDDRALYRKFANALFNESLDDLRGTYSLAATSFETLEPPDLSPATPSYAPPDTTPAPHSQPSPGPSLGGRGGHDPLPASASNAVLVEDWNRFLDQKTDLPAHASALGFGYFPGTAQGVGLCLRGLKHEQSEKFHGDLEALNRAYGSQFATWQEMVLVPSGSLLRRELPRHTPFRDAVDEFKERQPRWLKSYRVAEGYYRLTYLKNLYGPIADYNARHGTAFTDYAQVHLPRRLPEGPSAGGLNSGGGGDLERQDWEGFVRLALSPLWYRAEPAAAPAYHRFLQARYGTVEALNRAYGTAHTSIDAAPLVDEMPLTGPLMADWMTFTAGWEDPKTGQNHILPIAAVHLITLEFQFRDYLQARYGGLDGLNRALGTSFTDFLDISPPQREAHYQAFLEHRGMLRREFVQSNYLTVLDYMALHGRAIVNTVIYCGLAVLLALIVNPLAAYALSRFRLPSTYKILLFLMLTMAFPPAVTGIPVFLMIRNLGLLNTFAALLLPGLANGYSIFLLKGFFDSLPRELYESAALDGAGEWTMFWNFTMALSKPILAVIALGAFTGAYGNFMFALLICQDRDMWTLMPWLYSLQRDAHPGIVYASLLIAAIPTLLLFALAQNVIMRGIVVPAEK